MIRWLVVESITEEQIILKAAVRPGCGSCSGFCQKPIFGFISVNQGVLIICKKDAPSIFANPDFLFSNQRKKGQWVGLRWSEHGHLKTSFITYIYPLICVILGMSLGHESFKHLGWPVDSGAFLGLLLSGCLAWITSGWIHARGAMPKVTFF